MQRYDTDPAAKAAAATVLASKLGAESGLNLLIGDDLKSNVPSGRSNDVELIQSSGLRNRKQMHTRSSSTGNAVLQHYNSNEEMPQNVNVGTTGGSFDATSQQHNQPVVVDHYNPVSTTHDGGWIARIAALLVGEDPTQSYALICGNCHMHNGTLLSLSPFLFISLPLSLSVCLSLMHKHIYTEKHAHTSHYLI